MNDEELESALRDLAEPALPETWRAPILARARGEAARSRETWPSILVYLRHLFARNPVTVGGLAALWLLILVLKTGTPSDPVAERLLAREKLGSPGQITPLPEELRLVALLQDEADAQPVQQP